MLRVLHLTDPHLFADPRGALRGIVTRDSLDSVLRHYRESDWRADVAVVTGDVVNDDTAEAYELFRELMIDLGMPVYCLPGNHDVRSAMQQCLAEPPFYYCDAFEKANWLLVCLDSCVSGEAVGRLADAEFERLERLIESSSEEHVMICLHHPVVETGSAWLDAVGLENNNEVLKRLAAYERARLCVFGHVHQSIDTVHGGLRIFATPSTCGQFAPLSEEFSLADKPPAYRRFELHADGSIDQRLIWVD